MNNFDALKQMPLKPFANMAFDVARNKCETLEDFEKFLESEVPEDLKPVLKGALQNMQCPNANQPLFFSGMQYAHPLHFR